MDRLNDSKWWTSGARDQETLISKLKGTSYSCCRWTDRRLVCDGEGGGRMKRTRSSQPSLPPKETRVTTNLPFHTCSVL